MDSGEIMANNKDQGKMELSSEEKPIDSSASEKENKEKVDFKVVFNKKKFDVTFDMDDTIGAPGSSFKHTGLPLLSHCRRVIPSVIRFSHCNQKSRTMLGSVPLPMGGTLDTNHPLLRMTEMRLNHIPNSYGTIDNSHV